MSNPVVKLVENEYVEWSSVVDAPISRVLDREGIKKYLISKYGGPEENTEKRIARADKHGTSLLHQHYESVKDFVSFNRAGDKESCLTLEEIREQYK